MFFFFKQKTAYEMRISDWSSDVCSSVLLHYKYFEESTPYVDGDVGWYVTRVADVNQADRIAKAIDALSVNSDHETRTMTEQAAAQSWMKQLADIGLIVGRSEEQTSELQSLMRISYAVFCLKNKKN